MRKTIPFLILLLSGVIAGNSQEMQSVAVHNADAAWQKLNSMKAQQKVKVYLENGEKLKGTFVRAEESGILLRIKDDKSVQISREEILRITRRSWKKASLIGLGIGAGGGAIWGYAKPPFNDAGASRGGNVAGVAVFGALIGFCTGAAVGSEQTLYLSPSADGSSEVRGGIDLEFADIPPGGKHRIGSDDGRRLLDGP